MKHLSIVRMLRNRWLAVGLIALLTAYVILGTLVPQGAVGEPVVRAWADGHPAAERLVVATGFHQAYSAPLFMALIMLLSAATAACAWERTRRALAIRRSLRLSSDSHLERMSRHTSGELVPIALADAKAALSVIAGRLRGMRLKVEMGTDAVDGKTALVGLWGSPLFHWALVGLMLVIAAGQLTRADGNLVLPLSEGVVDEHANYTYLVEGALFNERHSRLEFVASGLDRDFVSEGVSYGPTPFVTAYRDGAVVAESWVRPNSPLRTGSLMVQMLEYGPALTLALESQTGGEVGRKTLALRRSELTSSGTEPLVFTSSTGGGTPPIDVRVQVVIQRGAADGQRDSKAIVETASVGADSFGTQRLVEEGEFIALPDNQRLRVAEVKDWVEVAVVNDWSVPYVYGLLITAIVGLAIALLVPTRRASVLLIDNAGVHFLKVRTWCARRDPLFERQVIEAVRSAVGETEDE